MEQYDNIYDKIQELLGHIPGTVSILEEQINADVQLEYFNYAQAHKNNINTEEVLRNRETIFHQDLAVEDKKHLIVQLASIDSIEAYRTLEKFSSNKKNKLKDWATLALQECRLLLESKMLDENHVLISTGLGGKGLKLRYFTVLITDNNKSFSSFQKKLITNELLYTIKKVGGEPEKIQFDKELCTILCLIPLQIAVQRMFDAIIKECNNYGSFIKTDYIITNVKIISNKEIRSLIKQSKAKK